MNCLNCQKQTINPKFCSRSCSAQYTNKINPKRKRTIKCKTCDKLILSTRTYCSNCRHAHNKDMTLQEAIFTKHHKTSAYALVRTRARIVIKKLGIKSCQHCGYDKHIEACHRIPIGDFELTTLLSVINSPDNLLGLCPNCHWEFDHNL